MSKKSWIILIIEALVFILVLGSITKCQSDKIDILEHNVIAYKDQIELVENKNGELVSIKESLILSESQAREELEITKAELKELKAQLGSKVAYIGELESKINLKDTIWMKPDTVILKDTLPNGNQFKQFYWENEWLRLKSSVIGPSILESSMSINALQMNVPLQVGLSNNYTFWVKSPNPYIKFTNIESIVIDGSSIHKEKRFHHGIYVGFGFQYGLFGKQWDFGPQGGYGFMYSF